MSLPKIILDTDKTTPIYEVPLKIRQGDTGDELQVTLGKSFQKYTDLSTVDVELIAKTPDQRLIKQAVTDKSENTFKVKFPDEMYTNVGVFRNMYFKIGDDSTSDIKLVVLQGIGSIKEAGSYIDDFETLIEEAQSYVLALKDFSDNGNAKIDNKVAELTGKMTDFVDKSKEDLDAAKAAWSTFQSSSQTAFTDAQDKRASDFNSQRSGFETGFNEQKADFENRFKALLATLQGDYDDFKALINKDVADFNTSLDSLDSRATDAKNKYDALKAQLDLAAQNISGVRTNLIIQSDLTPGYLDRDNDNVVFNDNDFHSDSYMATNGATVFTLSSPDYTFKGNFNALLKMYDSDKNYLGYQSITSATQTLSKPNVAYIRLSIYFVGEGGTSGNLSDWLSSHRYKLEKGPTATDWCLNPSEIATNDGVQTSIKNALDKADYSTNAEVDSKIATGVGQAKTYAEQSIKDIIGAAPATLDTIAELADAVTENKDGVQAINDGITKKADKTDVTALQNIVQTMITTISQEDYKALEDAGTVDPKIMYVILDT